MSWQDRIREAAYTAPDGTRIVFQFTDVQKTIRKKTIAHEFPSVDSTYVEDKGLKGTLYPLRVFFSGDNHDLLANQFESAITQRGPGTLDHPLYGRKTAIPFGDIIRSERLVSQANQTVFEVTFWETIAALFPSADQATLQLVDDAIAGYDLGGATQFSDSIDLTGAGEKSAFNADLRKLKDGAVKGLRLAKDGTAALQNKMDRIDKAINSALTSGIGTPLTLAFQLRQLIGAPARSVALLTARLEAYQALGRSIFAGNGTDSGAGTGTSDAGTGVVDPGTGAAGNIVRANNSFHANRLISETVVLGLASAVSGESYKLRQQALTAAKELADVFSEQIAWSELNYAELFDSSAGADATRPQSSGVGSIDTGEARQILLAVISQTVSYLIATSFTLGVERTLVLATPRTAIDLVSELYGGIERLDEFMDANEFTGDQILELPIGTRVRYYVE